jgi:Dyp-type peroxidase family
MAVNLNQTNFDPDDPNLIDLFKDMQGDILKGHGRDQSKHLFIRFSGVVNASRTWLRGFAHQVTSANSQHQSARDFETNGTEHMHVSLLLSADGYRALGFNDDEMPDDKAFRAGMKDLDTLYDTSPRGDHNPVANPLADNVADWEAPFQGQIHMLVILAYGGDHVPADRAQEAQTVLDEHVATLRAGMAGIAEIVHEQTGHVLRNESNQVIEHFGYVDGVSNPRFYKHDLDRERENGGFENNDPSAPLGLVLAPDPLGGRESHGSFFVYRKLQQNIKGFLAQKQALAAALSEVTGQEVSPAYAGALAVGRYKDGTPIGEQAGPGVTSLPNSYDYDHDTEARRCPFQSHARKTNPRGDTQRQFGSPISIERTRRVVRRAISYGSTDMSPDDEWTDAGLLFLCAQNNIEHQFVFMQHTWCNNENFLEKDIGLDPICGQAMPGTEPIAQNWPTKWGFRGGDISFSFSGSVRMRGGEYFFAPSLSFLTGL